MNVFKDLHFQRDMILWAVRWHCKCGNSYRELQDMLAGRGVNVDHITLYRWVQQYAPEMEKRLCGLLTAKGALLIFYLSPRRSSKAVYRFPGKILNNVKGWQVPHLINTDNAPTYGRALVLLRREGRCPPDVNTDRLST